jgi:CHAT domain-containing protein
VSWALEALSAPRSAPRRVVALGVGGEGLAHVEAEARAVANEFAEATLLLGDAATQAALRESSGGADVLHLACHAHFRADNPMFSALDLADGPLTLHATPSLGFQAQLVSLSACETGASHLAPGNEAIGLVRGFLLAGVRSVLASAWAVDDAATAELMRGFYQRLRAGEGAAQALAGVQRRLAKAGAHPFHWAAFALHGRG